MKKLAIIDFKGNFDHGFSATVKIWSGDRPTADPIAGKEGFLPSNSESRTLYKKWVEAYENYIKIAHQLTQTQDRENSATFALKQKPQTSHASLELDKKLAYKNCRATATELLSNFNDWLKSSQFSLIVEELKIHQPQRILIETNKFELRKMPWQKWDLLGSQNFALTEIGLTSPNFQSTNVELLKTSEKPASQDGVKILVVLGKDANIESTFEKFEEYQCDVTVVRNLPELDVPLWEKYWDILIFNGHSKTQGDGQQGIFQLSDGNWLTISDIKGHFRQAINHNLKLAIFNSCDGLGLAYQLAEGEDLHLPQIIVMRENLPVAIAPKFLQYFLENYTQGLSLYSSLRQSRQRLQILEKNFPCVSWLPVLCQNPAEIPPRWLELGGKIEKHPYKGLSAFTEKDTEIFFGRKVLTNSLLEKVERQKLVAIIGASGSGKSSLVAAGLIPQWLDKATEILPRFVVKIRPGFPHPNPWENLAEELGKISSNLTANNLAFLELVGNLEANSGELAKYLTGIEQEKNGCKILLVIDQFEELYTLCSEEKRRSFLAGLVDAINYDGSWKVVLTLRADFLSLVLDEDLGKIFDERDKLITPMNDEDLTEAIALPAQKFEVEFADELIKRMIQDYRQNSGHLPMLQFALEELWKRQKYGVISLASYEEIGGLTQVLGDYAEKIYINLSREEKEQARYIFTQLVQPISQEKSGEVSRIATRKIATFADIGKENWQLVIKFADERLVVTNKEKDVASVELIHEVLITAWSRLKNWIEQDWEFRRWQEKLRDNLSKWEQEKKDDFLLQGGLLKEAESWLEKPEQKIPEKEREYIEKSRKRRENKLQQLILGLTVGLAIVSIAATIAVWQRQRADFQALQAEKQRQEADTQRVNAQLITSSLLSDNLFNSNKRLEALIEAIKAGRQIQQTNVEVQPDAQNRVVIALQQAVYGVRERNQWEEDQNSVHTISFSPDGKMIATAGQGKIKLWSRDGTLLKSFDLDSSLTTTYTTIYKVSFSPDSKMLAAGVAVADMNDPNIWKLGEGSIHAVQLWSIDGKLLKTIKAHSNYVQSVRFSPDGKIIASASADKTVKLWSLDGRLLRTLQHSTFVRDISFSPDGQTIATNDDDTPAISKNSQTVKLWSIDGQEIKTLQQHSERIGKLTFSPDGQMIASMSTVDGTVKLWSIDGQEIKTMKAHNPNYAEHGNVSFSPDGKTIATTGDETIKLWSSEGTLIETLKGHNTVVIDVNFSPDGQTIASVDIDGTVKLWNRESIKPPTLPSWANNLSFSSDSRTIALAVGKEVKLYNRNNGTLLKTIEAHTNTKDVSFSSDGQTVISIGGFNALAVAMWGLFSKPKALSQPDGFMDLARQQLKNQESLEKTVKLWSLDGGLLKTIDATNHTLQHQGHILPVTDAIFTSDGKMIASGSWDGNLNLWTLDGSYGTLVRRLQHDNVISCLAISNDNQIAAVASGTDIVMYRTDGTEPKVLKGHSEAVVRISFNPDGQKIASASLDGTVKLWSSDGTELGTMKHDNNMVADVSFSPDGQTILSAGSDGLRLWNLSGERLAQFGGTATEQYTGVGMRSKLNQDQTAFTITEIFKNSPTKKAGLKVGDQILAVNGKSTAGMSDEEHTDLLRGEVGTKVILKVSRRAKNPFNVTITRGIIKTSQTGLIPYSTAKFSSDGQVIVAGSGVPDIGTIKLWSRDGKLLKTLKGHQDFVSDLKLSPDGKMFASASEDKTVKLWSLDGEELRTLHGHGAEVRSVNFSPDGKMLTSASLDGVARVWRIDGTLVKPLLGNYNTFSLGNPTSVSVNPDGKTFALANENEVQLWNLEGTLLKIVRPDIRVWFAPDGNVITSGESVGGHHPSVSKVLFSSDGKMLASSGDKTVKLWNSDGSLLKSLEGHTAEVYDVSFSSDNQFLASASLDKTVRLWNLGDNSVKILRGHNDSVKNVSFSSSGLLASGSEDKTVKLWSSDGTLLKTFNSAKVSGVRFSPDGKTLAVASDKVTLWNFDLDDLIVQGCDWARDYLKTNANVAKSDRNLCNGINTD